MPGLLASDALRFSLQLALVWGFAVKIVKYTGISFVVGGLIFSLLRIIKKIASGLSRQCLVLQRNINLPQTFAGRILRRIPLQVVRGGSVNSSQM
jgi:hypothetical protein